MPGRKKILDAPSGALSSPAGTEAVPVTGSKYVTLTVIAGWLRTLTQTLTGKTINLTENTLTGTKAQFNTAVSDGNIAYDTFKTIAVSGQSDVVADSDTDTLTLVAGTGMTITTNASTDTITLASSGGGAVATDVIWDAKGDLAGGTGANTAVKLTVGSNGQVLTADSGETTGLKWVNPGAGTDVATDVIWDAKGDLAGGTGSNTAAKLSVGTNGFVLTADSGETTGMKWAASAGGGGIVDYDIQRYTGGNITLNNTAWTDVSGPADLSISATAGDLLEVGISCLWGSETLESYLDFASIVSSSPVNYVSGGSAGASNRGVVGWQSFQGPLGGGMNVASIGSILYVVQAGDISGGSVALRLRFRTSAGSNKTLFATSDIPLHLFVKNLGQ